MKTVCAVLEHNRKCDVHLAVSYVQTSVHGGVGTVRHRHRQLIFWYGIAHIRSQQMC